MRILIIATERSGGFQLTKWISWEMGYKLIHEPIIPLNQLKEKTLW
jgi:hypothetical protein